MPPVWNQTHALRRHRHQRGLYADAAEEAGEYPDRRKILAGLKAQDARRSAQAMHAHQPRRRDRWIAAIEEAPRREASEPIVEGGTTRDEPHSPAWP